MVALVKEAVRGQKKYVYTSYIDDVAAMVTSDGTSTFYFHRDATFSTRVVTDSEGDIAERYEYTPFGEGSFLDVGLSWGLWCNLFPPRGLRPLFLSGVSWI